MFNYSVLHSITADKWELGYPYDQPVSHGHIIKVHNC